MQIEIGDSVQWTCNGVDMFVVPRKVKGFSDCGDWAFVEGTNTGIPVRELHLRTIRFKCPHCKKMCKSTPDTAGKKARCAKCGGAISIPERLDHTPEQLAAAKETYAKHGAEYRVLTRQLTKQKFHIFTMPVDTTDTGLKLMPELPFRFGLSFGLTKVTDAGLKELRRLKNLVYLDIWNTQVTDLGLKDVGDLKNLIYLDLGRTNVTDAGLKELDELKNLIHLNLADCKVTDYGVKRLKSALPNCEIRFGLS